MNSKRLSSTKPPHKLVFFTDRDLGRYIIPGKLEAAGVGVERHDTHFDQDTPDVVWMPIVAERGWLAVSHNVRQRYVPEERDMAMRSGLAILYLVGKATHAELGDNLVRTLPKIIAFRDKHDPPFLA